MNRGKAIRNKLDSKPNSYPIKIYFPTISRDIIQNTVFDNNGRKGNVSPLLKYLVNENALDDSGKPDIEKVNPFIYDINSNLFT